MQQQLPHKPTFVSDSEWQFICQRDQHRCALHSACVQAGQSVPCDEFLDVDHAQPRELGGDDTFANLRLLCRGPNRGRPCESLAYWTEPNYWDTKLHERGLRQIQSLAGPQAIVDVVDRAPVNLNEMRRYLLSSITLLAGATGIGKTLLVQAILFKLNELIGIGYPRIKHVLWLTTDTHLRDLAKTEIETEAYELRIAERKPVVGTAESFADLVRGPQNRDVVVSASQALWMVEKNGVQRRSIEEKRAVLAPFDTIIFDEGDWGEGEVRHIAQIANHALKLAPTASPLISQIADKKVAEEFLRRFVLISSDAVADYQRARRLDACLKQITSPIIGAAHKGRDELRGGKLQSSDQQVTEDHALYRTLILEQIQAADDFETRMRHLVPDDFYSPHVMVRMDTTGELKAMYRDLRIGIKDKYDRGELKNHGWDVSVIFQGHTRMKELDRSEHDLAKRDKTGDYHHPFMRAKNNDGQCRFRDGNKRVLLMCQIGIRGINNWPIQTIIDCTGRASIGDLVQFVFGRPIRWPVNRAHWLSNDADGQPNPLVEFTQMSIAIPPRSRVEDKEDALTTAKNFIENMQEQIGAAGFLTWGDLFEGGKIDDADIAIDPSNRPLTPEEKFSLQAALAAELQQHGSLDNEAVQHIVGTHYGDRSERIREKLSNYGTRLVNEEPFRDHELNATKYFEEYQARPECVIDKLQPLERYPIDMLKTWVKSDPEFKNYYRDLIAQLDNNPSMALLLSDMLRIKQRNNYRSPSRTFELYGKENGVITEVADELAVQLYRAGQAPADKSLVPRAILRALRRIFAVTNADKGGPLDHPAYHIAIVGRLRRKIQAMARTNLIHRGELGDSMQAFAGKHDDGEEANDV